MESLDFQTGDLLLFSGKKSKFFNRLIESCTGSQYSHVGIVIKDPPFNEELKGLYILESTDTPLIKDAEDGKYKMGVALKPLKEKLALFDGELYWRKLHIDRNDEFNKRVCHLHDIVHGKPYDLNLEDWIEAKFMVEFGDVHKKDTFICSALASFFLVGVQAISKDTPWTIMRPADLGTEPIKRHCLIMINGTAIDSEIHVP